VPLLVPPVLLLVALAVILPDVHGWAADAGGLGGRAHVLAPGVAEGRHVLAVDAVAAVLKTDIALPISRRPRNLPIGRR
jgi:hypothetical protein